MQPALSAPVWSSLCQRLSHAPRVLLALDFDGTLAPIVERPDKATLPSSISGLLKALVQKPGYRVAIVTRRALADVKRRIGIDGLIYCGNQGLEMLIDGRMWLAPGAATAQDCLKEAREALPPEICALEGVLIEDKGLSLSVHYRRSPPEAKRLCLRLCRKALEPFLAEGQLKLVQGKEVLEVQAALPWDKGVCLQHMAKLTLPGGLRQGVCVFLGDDTSDEPAFRAVRDMGGMGIVIGEKADSAAHFFLPSTTSVGIFLRRLVSIPHD